MPNSVTSSKPPELDIELMQTGAQRACALMKVLSNPDRLLLLCKLAESELCVSELQELLGIVQPTLSQQLTVLREEGLVQTRREGKNIYYQLSSPEALAVMQTLFAQFCPQPQAKRSTSKRGIA